MEERRRRDDSFGDEIAVRVERRTCKAHPVVKRSFFRAPEGIQESHLSCSPGSGVREGDFFFEVGKEAPEIRGSAIAFAHDASAAARNAGLSTVTWGIRAPNPMDSCIVP